jgi:hypothetical protein
VRPVPIPHRGDPPPSTLVNVALMILQTLEASVGPDGFHFLAEIEAFDGAVSA